MVTFNVMKTVEDRDTGKRSMVPIRRFNNRDAAWWFANWAMREDGGLFWVVPLGESD